jgi:hypothetical protein
MPAYRHISSEQSCAPVDNAAPAAEIGRGDWSKLQIHNSGSIDGRNFQIEKLKIFGDIGSKLEISTPHVGD